MPEKTTKFLCRVRLGRTHNDGQALNGQPFDCVFNPFIALPPIPSRRSETRSPKA